MRGAKPAERTLKPQCCLQATLEQDDLTTRYLAVPLCFAQLQSTEPRKFVISAHSTQPLSIERKPHTSLPATCASPLAPHAHSLRRPRPRVRRRVVARGDGGARGAGEG